MSIDRYVQTFAVFFAVPLKLCHQPLLTMSEVTSSRIAVSALHTWSQYLAYSRCRRELGKTWWQTTRLASAAVELGPAPCVAKNLEKRMPNIELTEIVMSVLAGRRHQKASVHEKEGQGMTCSKDLAKFVDLRFLVVVMLKCTNAWSFSF